MEKRRNDLTNEAAAGIKGSVAVDTQSALAMAVEIGRTASQLAAEAHARGLVRSSRRDQETKMN